LFQQFPQAHRGLIAIDAAGGDVDNHAAILAPFELGTTAKSKPDGRSSTSRSIARSYASWRMVKTAARAIIATQ
jgi:hypothetical protein